VRKRSGLGANSLLVISSVLAIGGVCFCLRRVLDVGIVEQILDADQELLDGDCWPPVLILVQQAEANCSRRVDVGVKQWGTKLDLGRGGGKVLLENHVALVKAAFPRSRLLSRNSKLPLHQVQCAVRVLGGTGDESEGVVLTPLLPLLGETRLSYAGHFVVDVVVDSW